MITGTWKLLRGEQNGEPEPQEDLDRSKLEIVDNQHTVTIGDAVLKGSHSLNASNDPMTIDSVDSAGPFEGMALKGIFKLDADVLTVCFAAPGVEHENPGADRRADASQEAADGRGSSRRVRP